LRKRADADSAIGTDPSMVVYGGAVGGCGSSYMADRQADRCTVGSFTGRGRLAAAVCRNLWPAAVFGTGQQHILLLYGLWGCRRSAYFGTKAGGKSGGASSAG